MRETLDAQSVVSSWCWTSHSPTQIIFFLILASPRIKSSGKLYMSRPSHFAYLHPRPRFRWGLNQKFPLPAFLSSIPLPSSFCLLCIPLQEAWLLSLAFFAYPMHTPVYTCTHTHTQWLLLPWKECVCVGFGQLPVSLAAPSFQARHSTRGSLALGRPQECPHPPALA